MNEPDWMEEPTRVATVADLRRALADKPAEMRLLGFYDSGFGLADDVFVGVQVRENGDRFLAIDVENLS